jgi:PKD repeat protein
MQTQTTHTYARGGTYNVKLEVVDELGLRDTIEKTVEASQAPLADPDAYFTEYIAPESYTAEFYDQSTSLNGGEITEWYWDLGDGAHISMEPNITHTYAYNGTYTVKLEVVDNYGARATIERQFTIQGASRGDPEAYFTFYNDLERNLTFYDASTSPNGAITERYWDLGDGTFIQDEQIFEHTYQEAGVYNVVLEVVDVLGERDTYNVVIDIQ